MAESRSPRPEPFLLSFVPGVVPLLEGYVFMIILRSETRLAAVDGVGTRHTARRSYRTAMLPVAEQAWRTTPRTFAPEKLAVYPPLVPDEVFLGICQSKMALPWPPVVEEYLP